MKNDEIYKHSPEYIACLNNFALILHCCSCCYFQRSNLFNSMELLQWCQGFKMLTFHIYSDAIRWEIFYKKIKSNTQVTHRRINIIIFEIYSLSHKNKTLATI